ncbi:MAG: 16S rRNA (guanine(966)-N(2))-methyltransferase RsmD [Syntrophus sp. (in: bacteria)]|nr:16S rRNA (guanine(966)-N(2))-methyltransferase RsmD [Syntrophus sp. (in: bacteria)]
MRIIGGEVRGRRLYIPRSSAVRPTADRIKEAFFNIIGLVDGKIFLDLFAGTGNMGLEALSRGVLKAAFVENNRALVDTIGKNIEICGFGGKSEVLKSDFIEAIQSLAKRSDTFDILFADPPYEQGLVNRLLEHPEIGSLMARDGLFAVQHSVREAISISEPDQLLLADQRQYGDTILSFFKKRDDRE